MSELISGKEAKIAWANGKNVEMRNMFVGEDFHKINEEETALNVFDFDFFQFRLKTSTINLSGIEVPCCGENYQYGDAMYILNSLEPEEYSLVVLDKADEVPAYWWKTEEEIKQVVEALRSIFK